MSRKLVSALVVIALVIIVLILNAGSSVTVEFHLFDVRGASRAVVFFCFTAVGVVIGLLLK